MDDDNSISELITLYLERECYEALAVPDGEEALRVFPSFKPHLVILDLMLPGIDGYGVCRRIRAESSVPVIILSAKGETFDKVLGLELGADDYMEKPFDPKELLARIKAVLRRAQGASSFAGSEGRLPQQHREEEKVQRRKAVIEYPDLVVDQTNYSVLYKGKDLEMPPKELELLYFLACSPNRVFTRDQLLDNIWGYDFRGDSRTVDVHVKRLREKIPGNENWEIATVWGIGYKFKTV